MARMIMINEDVFNREFDILLDKLKLERFVEGGGVIRTGSEFENSRIGTLHGTFRYEVCKFKDILRNS